MYLCMNWIYIYIHLLVIYLASYVYLNLSIYQSTNQISYSSYYFHDRHTNTHTHNTQHTHTHTHTNTFDSSGAVCICLISVVSRVSNISAEHLTIRQWLNLSRRAVPDWLDRKTWSSYTVRGGEPVPLLSLSADLAEVASMLNKTFWFLQWTSWF